MDEERLAGHEVEALVRERQFLGRGEAVGETVGEPRFRGLRGRLLDPTRLAVDADERRVGREHVAQEAPPVPDPGADVEHCVRIVEPYAPRPDLDVVEVPPEVALGAEELR